MKSDNIFFSTEGIGLTSTSAEHVSNLAKETIRTIEASLQSLVLYSTDVSLIGSSSKECLGFGATEAELATIEEKLRTIAKAKSLIAWLREAIKAKERLLKELKTMTILDYAEQMGYEIPQTGSTFKVLTDDDYIATLTVAERNRYFESETLAAVIGSAIHPGGALADARETLTHCIQSPRKVKGEGRDALIYSYTPTVDPAKVDSLYFRLQKIYREAQAKVNRVKYECEKAVKESELIAKQNEKEEIRAYESFMKNTVAEMKIYVSKRMSEIGNYRIVIPESLTEIYNQITHIA